MATALARGLIGAKIVPAQSIVASDPSTDARTAFEHEVPSCDVANDNVAKVGKTDAIFLAVKPQTMATRMKERAIAGPAPGRPKLAEW